MVLQEITTRSGTTTTPASASHLFQLAVGVPNFSEMRFIMIFPGDFIGTIGPPPALGGLQKFDVIRPVVDAVTAVVQNQIQIEPRLHDVRGNQGLLRLVRPRVRRRRQIAGRRVFPGERSVVGPQLRRRGVGRPHIQQPSWSAGFGSKYYWSRTGPGRSGRSGNSNKVDTWPPGRCGRSDCSGRSACGIRCTAFPAASEWRGSSGKPVRHRADGAQQHVVLGRVMG